MNMIVIPHRSIRAMLLGLALVLGVTTMTPTTSHAIPSAGDYSFTSGLTGTFTSDGSKLTAWNFTDAYAFNWSQTTPGIFVAGNEPGYFYAQIFSGALNSILIAWDLGISYSDRSRDPELPAGITFARVSSSVPEPSSALLAGLGLLLLLGYSWRQRRQAGLHVG